MLILVNMATNSGCVKSAAQGNDRRGGVVPADHRRLWTPDEELIIHDRENEDAWIQSNVAVSPRGGFDV